MGILIIFIRIYVWCNILVDDLAIKWLKYVNFFYLFLEIVNHLVTISWMKGLLLFRNQSPLKRFSYGSHTNRR